MRIDLLHLAELRNKLCGASSGVTGVDCFGNLNFVVQIASVIPDGCAVRCDLWERGSSPSPAKPKRAAQITEFFYASSPLLGLR